MIEPEIQVDKTRPGDAEFDRVLTIMEAMLDAASQDQLANWLGPQQHSSLTMAAAAVMSGYIAGAWIVSGWAKPQDKRRMGEAALASFRQGIALGEARAAAELMGKPEGNA